MVLMEALVHQRKMFSINFSKANTKLCLSLHYDTVNSYLFVNGKEIFIFKAENKTRNLQTQFCLGNISNWFSAKESANENVYNFQLEYKSINKFDIL